MDIKRIIIAVLAIGALASCQKQQEEPAFVPGKKIALSGIREAGFAEGTSLGIFIGEPVNYENVKLTIKGFDVEGADKLYWAAEQTEYSHVFAYAPYQEGLTSEEPLVFSVAADQSAEGALAASDLLIASCTADPTAANLSLRFSHKMSQVHLYFRNLTGQKIQKVRICNVCTYRTYDIKKGVEKAGGASSDIVTYPAISGADTCFVAYFPPQELELPIKVTLADGTDYDFSLEKQSFTQGYTYSNSQNPIKLGTEPPVKISLSFSVSDWADGGQLLVQGQEPEPAPTDTAAFVAINTYGFYTGACGGKPVAVYEYNELEHQAISGTSGSSREAALVNFADGSWMKVTLNSKTLAEGSSYSASATVDGASFTYTALDCVRKTSTAAWLADKGSRAGFIIPVE